MAFRKKRQVFWWTVTLVGIMVGIRVLYAIATPQVFYNSDSGGYLGLGKGMYASPSLPTIINPYRTPLYPLFFQGILMVSGYGESVPETPAFFQGASVVAATQSILTIAAFLLLFFALLSLPLPTWMSWCLTLGISSDYHLFTWERTMLTEGLAIPWIVALSAAMLFTLRARKAWWYLVLEGLFILGFLLRPAFLFVPFVVVGVLLLHRRKAAMVIVGAIMLAIYLLVPLGYAKVNEHYHHYFGIQHVGDIDLLGRILEFRLPVDAATNYPFYYEAVIDSRKKGMVFPNPFRFLEYYDPYIYMEGSDGAVHLNELPGFNKTVILHTIPTYVNHIILSLPKVLTEVCDFITIPPDTSAIASFFRVLRGIAIAMQYTFFAVPIFWFVSVYQCIRKPSSILAALVFFGALAVIQLLFTASVVYTDVDQQFGRIMAVVRPHMLLFLGLWMYHAWTHLRTRKRMFFLA
ncbi:hypothetical protein A2Z00_04100 [Candidatus Gottesmanbacteria bacterium RBG_13_45_10]|uniref:Glycosyltransferase RgtA/B/C/D-like domain-containing protein n=1 Tax=Candidatus Gottesmanbacteria bacterium RBG_13_45_10 TaxID=1798370 RepID=A0A1F5ZHN4_9BACT|nr:MAG: hypothetical protein A2Z00_04100 [Candidatus Gottesmanbacteria bacterium RBG_13_45_10]